jgi:hypothetical protein
LGGPAPSATYSEQPNGNGARTQQTNILTGCTGVIDRVGTTRGLQTVFDDSQSEVRERCIYSNNANQRERGTDPVAIIQEGATRRVSNAIVKGIDRGANQLINNALEGLFK